MIKYRCASCGSELETEDNLSGKDEACPVCGQTNKVPLSKHELAEIQKQHKEKLQQARDEALRTKHAEAQTVKLEMQRQATEEQQAQQEQRPKALRPTMTEATLGLLGGTSVALGVLAAVVIVAFPHDTGRFDSLRIVLAIVAVWIGFLCGVPFFIAHQVLRYLRRIMNAVERRE